MATTSIWRVKGWLGKVLIYVENPDKTENPAVFEKQGIDGQEAQGLSDVIEYAVRQEKTGRITPGEEGAPVMQRFVSGVNCSSSTARDEMMAVKKRFGKEDGTVAYHGYQSFAPGEATPELAHEIGLALAKKLWGEKYQVLVTTHLDKAHHLHNHFVVNTVSFVDGMGVTVLEEEKRLPIIILEPGKAYRREDGSVGQNFYAKEVYDISQTTARDEAQPQVSYDDRLLLKGLIASSPVPIRAVEELPQGRGAVYDPEQNAILVKKGMDAPDIFRCVSLEAANVQLAQSHEGYSREAEGYKAYAVSYMLCQRYGVDVKGYDISRLDGVLQGQDPREEVPAALTDMRDTFKEMNGRMARAMGLTRTSRQKEQER